MPRKEGRYMAAWQHSFRACLIVIIGFFWPIMTLAQDEVVSTSLCADSYVLALVEPRQIKALSWQANSKLSRAPDAVRSLPRAWPSQEVLLSLSPAKIVLGSGDNIAATSLAEHRGSKAMQLAPATDFTAIENNLSKLGEFLNKQGQAKTVISSQRIRLQSLQARKQSRHEEPSILYLTPTLGTAGYGTFIDAAIIAAGARNFATELGIENWSRVPLELLATQQPDLIITSFFRNGSPSILQFRANHSILKGLQQKVPQKHIPGGLWVCGGPLLITAAEQIADALDQRYSIDPKSGHGEFASKSLCGFGASKCDD
ncbi:MAG: ABC transporter substrate-binding protein [Robiginitomaculum sp.]|nr:ABC transporter substrate-binding protein [Robiginitomaculum sp.]